MFDLYTIQMIREKKPLFDTRHASRYTPEIIDYISYYGMLSDTFDHYYGYIDCKKYRIFANVFVPPRPKGNILFNHGLYNHTGSHWRFLSYLLEQGYTVLTYDFPGHGLSSGERFAVGDFSDYTDVMLRVIDTFRKEWKPPYRLAAFSTGGSCYLDYLLRNHDELFDKTALVAPLIRSFLWEPSKVSYNLVAKRFGALPVPKFPSYASSDPDFKRRYLGDPLMEWTLPMSWVGALIRWNERIERLPRNDKEILVIQGDKDWVVDYKYNLAFLAEKFPNMRLKVMSGSKHDVLNETYGIRHAAYETIVNFLS
ncbi:MAG: alpha/beta hydrolase [Brevinematales bacterium]|nr:alpha/beta hydrolase [Brevinematales bacterium]